MQRNTRATEIKSGRKKTNETTKSETIQVAFQKTLKQYTQTNAMDG